MGGKGQRRREKNYLAAHGGHVRLPPPPNAKEHETLPSKLRKMIQLKNFSVTKHGTEKSFVETGYGKKNVESSSKKYPNLKESRSPIVTAKLGDDIVKTKNNIVKEKNASVESYSANVKKRKRKRNSVKDLRFEDLGQFAKHSKRKERKKEYLKERKNKYMKVKVNDGLDFPGRENIMFGEVVMAPPKLSLPKESRSSTVIAKLRDDIKKTNNNIVKDKSVSAESSPVDAKKRKRKKNLVEDIRADDCRKFSKHSNLKERKEYLKDIRDKYMKVKMNTAPEFPGREHIIFREGVKAPPILSLSKAPKRTMDASTESLRLQSVELYRNRRRWDSRPGIKLPSLVATATF